MTDPTGGPGNLPPLECRIASVEKRLDAMQTHVEATSKLVDATLRSLQELLAVAERLKIALAPVDLKPTKPRK